MAFDLQELFLGWIVTYGSPMIALALFLGQIGIPVPGTLLVIASGAFVRQGFLGPLVTPLFGLLGAIAGDIVVYSVGRFAREWIERRFGHSALWKQAQASFEQRGGLAIYLTRWLLTPIAVPTTLIAGGSGYPFSRWLLLDAAGELTWLAVYGGLGYGFGSQWQLISDFIANYLGIIVGVLVLIAGVYLLVRSRMKETVPVSEDEAVK